MEVTKKQYLESLNDWGEHIKSKLKNADIPEHELNELIDQLDNWQLHINRKLEGEYNPKNEELHLIKTEGERILFDIKNKKNKQVGSSIPFGEHQLPPLPYKYNALEPYISEKIMRLHHDEHHQSYVDGLNEAEKALYTNKKDEKPIKHWLREQAFHGSGHNLHTIFWNNMTPESSKKPSGELLKRIEEDFGTWNKFKELFSDVAASVEGNGWAVLLWLPRSGRLGVQSFEKHQLFQLADAIPLLVLDVWEHAYYLQYQTDKKAYIKNWWNVVNWDNVNNRYTEARKVQWPIF